MKRLWPSFLVMAVAATLAAAVQEFAPPLGALRLKPPLLCAVVVYYAMRREPVFAAAAAVACGAAEDALSGVPGAVSLVVFCAGAWFLAKRFRPQMREGALSCAVAGFAAAPIALAAQYFAMRLGGGLAPQPAWHVAARIVAAAPLGFLAAFAAARALFALDWISANVEDAGEDGDDDLAA